MFHLKIIIRTTMAKTNQLLLEENKQEKKSEPVSMDTVGVRQTNPTEVGSNCN